MQLRTILLSLVLVACGDVVKKTDGGVADDAGTDGSIDDADIDAPPNPLAPFPSNGSDGAFAPTANTVLAPRVYQYTTIDIPMGVTVTTNGTGVLELRAQGAVTIAGTVDLSGGNGRDVVAGIFGAGGGTTGNPLGTSTDGDTNTCPTGGGGGLGAAGGVAQPNCGGTIANTAGRSGGGAGGQFQGGGGSGGGGFAGGSGGRGGAGASQGGTGGAAGTGVGNGGQPDGGVYAGANGASNALGAFGGGGGSIGRAAIDDLAVASTFQPGSGGGGGAAAVQQNAGPTGGTGGGGGGGALRIASPVSITITGIVRANGGAGGATNVPAARPAGGGGGGSGGVIFLSSPSLTVSGTVSAIGGAGGGPSAPGGAGGLGRVRISATAATCSLTGTVRPPLVDGCNAGSGVGNTFVAAFPD